MQQCQAWGWAVPMGLLLPETKPPRVPSELHQLLVLGTATN